MSKLPVVTELPIDGRTGNFSLPWRQWLQTVDRALGDAGTDTAALAVQVAAIATALGSPDGTVENIPDQESLDVVIYGRNGVTVTGKAGMTPVYVELEPVEDDGTGALLAVTLDQYGRVIGSKAATITGTANRITVTNGDAVAGVPTVNISAAYVGQNTITTLGTISTGTWQGTAVAAAYGGTGQTSYTTGDMLVATGATTLSKVAAGTSTHVWTSNGPGVAPSWQAAAGGGGGAWTTVKKTADETRSATTTLADDALLKFTTTAGIRYRVRVHVMYATANATMDFKYTPAYSAAFSGECTIRRQHAPAASIGTDNEGTMVSGGVINSGGVGVVSTSSGNGYVVLEIIFVATAGGTFSFQWAQNTSDAGNLTVLAGSYLEYMTS